MVKKNQLIISIVGTILLLLLCSAKGLGQGKESYRQAYTRLVQMLEGKDSLDFKKAVFLTENAYFENSLNYDAYNDQITALAKICRRVGDQPKFKDVANNVQYNWAVHQFITDTLDFALGGDTIRKLPYRYDTLDPSGQKDIINTFLLKLLQTGTGNCRSLTYLYKILADELGAESFFTLAPYHIYIQHFDPPNRYHERRAYNLELTNGSFPRDGWIIAGSYITWTAIRNGMYGVRLNAKQNIALCLSDLGVSYERQFGTDDFLLKLYQTARKYHPENAQNRVRLAESYRKIGKVSSADSLCATLVLEGYREMPDRMYDLWRTEVRKDKDALHSDTSRTYEAPKDPFGNPMPTLSKGKFKEDADQTDSTRVGSVVVNCQTGKVIRYLEEARVYDVSRFLSLDPLTATYPYYTPYQFAGNKPIYATDLQGLQEDPAVKQPASIGTAIRVLRIVTQQTVKKVPPQVVREGIDVVKGYVLDPNEELRTKKAIEDYYGEKGMAVPGVDAKTAEKSSEVVTGKINQVLTQSINQTAIDNVINETQSGAGNITSKHVLTEDQALGAMQEWVGEDYTQVGKTEQGTFRSKVQNPDGSYNQARMDPSSLQGTHSPNVPHIHLEKVIPNVIQRNSQGKATGIEDEKVVNNHIPIKK
jgi:hypothetical protein